MIDKKELAKVIKKDDGLNKIESELEIVLKTANDLKIIDAESQAKASDTIKFLGKLATKMDNHRKEQVKPYNKAMKDYKKIVDGVIKIANDAKKALTDKAGIYAREQIRIEEERRREEEDRLLLEQKEQAEKDLLNAAELHNNEDVLEQAVEVSEHFEKKLQENKTTKHDVKFASRGSAATGFMKDNFKGEVINIGEALQFIIDSGRYELIKFQDGEVNKLAKTKLKELKQDQAMFKGFSFRNDKSYQVR